MILAFALVLVWLFGVFFTWCICRVAALADEASHGR